MTAFWAETGSKGRQESPKSAKCPCYWAQGVETRSRQTASTANKIKDLDSSEIPAKLSGVPRAYHFNLALLPPVLKLVVSNNDATPPQAFEEERAHGLTALEGKPRHVALDARRDTGLQQLFSLLNRLCGHYDCSHRFCRGCPRRAA